MKRPEKNDETVGVTDAAWEQHLAEEMNRLDRALEASEAEDAGLTITQWRGLSEHERITLREDSLDGKYARDQHLTLDEYRAKCRRQIEAGERSAEDGVPLWLRNIYAAEKPYAVVCKYLALLLEGETAHGERLKEIQKAIDARTGQGLVCGSFAHFPPFEESAQRLRDEIERLGLGELFREAEAQQREAK
jgi:hypothetical protein